MKNLFNGVTLNSVITKRAAPSVIVIILWYPFNYGMFDFDFVLVHWKTIILYLFLLLTTSL